MDKQARVELTSWSRFDTPNLEIAPALLGQSHVFTFDGHRIEISLPSADRLAGFKDAGDDPLVDRRISVVGWRKQDGWRQPQEIAVHDVGVICNIRGRTSIPEEARTTPITHEHFSEEQKKHLDKLATDYGDLAYRAFDLWIRTLRWKADSYRIGTPEVSGVKATGWQSEIREKDSPNRFWKSGQYITLFVGKPVTGEVWNKVSEALNAEESPPIFYDLLYSAMARLERGDLRLTIIDAAVAAETFMRTAVQASLSAGLDASLEGYSKDTSIRQIVNKFFPKCLYTEQEDIYKKTIMSKLHKLFDDRNSIMHQGQKEGLTESRCQKIISSVRELMALEPRKAA